MTPHDVQFPAIDADGHILERQQDIRRYMESPWQQRNTDLWPGDQPWDAYFSGKIARPAGYRNDMSPAEQVDVWLKAMDEYNIEKAVLFPTGTHTSPKLNELPFAIAVLRAANNLFAKEFTTNRLRPVGVLPMRDLKESIRELKRGINELGLVAFELTTNGLPWALGDSHFDEFYKEAERLGAAICIHGTRHWAHEFGSDRLSTFGEVHAYSFPAGIMMQFTSVMCQGIPERFPGLHLAFLEVGASWLPYYLDRLDEHWEKRGDVEMPHLSKKPSAVFRESKIKVSIEADESLLPETIAHLGVDHFFYATDIPHWDCEFPYNLIDLRKSTKFSDKEKHKILYQNAKDFFRL